MFNKTKIISTIGPSTNHPHLISKLIKNGMNIARLNMSHEANNKKIQSNNCAKYLHIESPKCTRVVTIDNLDGFEDVLDLHCVQKIFENF